MLGWEPKMCQKLGEEGQTKMILTDKQHENTPTFPQRHQLLEELPKKLYFLFDIQWIPTTETRVYKKVQAGDPVQLELEKNPREEECDQEWSKFNINLFICEMKIRALQEIRKLQRTTDLQIRRLPFCRLVEIYGRIPFYLFFP